MKNRAKIIIKNTDTNEVVSYFDNITEDDIPIWKEGNYSCDCNRYLFFRRAKGDTPKWNDGECGDGKFLVNISVDGDFLMKEFDGE